MTVLSGSGVTEQPTQALWLAVDQITKPTTRRIHRDDLAEWLEALATAPDVTVCDVAAYRAATVSHGVVPSLWEQAEIALTTGNESSGGQPSPLAYRSPADLDLMETMLTIRESMAWQLPGRHIVPKPTIPEQMRQLAAHVGGHEPQHVEWWTYRFAQWARTLAVYLRAVETGPKPRRLRGSPCPKCNAKTVLTDTDQGEVVAQPLLVKYVNGYIHCVQCEACSFTYWRGEDLWELAKALANGPDTPEPAVVVA